MIPRSSLALTLLLGLVALALSDVLEPPYFDIARGKYIEATSTCGEGLPVNQTSEMFCKIAGVASGRNDVQGEHDVMVIIVIP